MYYFRCLLTGFLAISMVASPLAPALGWGGCCGTGSYSEVVYDASSCCSTIYDAGSCGDRTCGACTCGACSCEVNTCGNECDAGCHSDHRSACDCHSAAPIESGVVITSSDLKPVPADQGEILNSDPIESQTAITSSDPHPPLETPPLPPEHASVPTIVGDGPAAEDTATGVETPSADPSPAPTEDNSEQPAEETDDLFGPPTPDAAEATLPEGSGIEPATEEPETEEPETEEPAAEPSELEDLFGNREVREILTQDGGLESSETKVWTDDTGQYRCVARLLEAKLQTVILVKPNGDQATVDISRLSSADLRFVGHQVSARREMLAQRAAADKLAAN